MRWRQFACFAFGAMSAGVKGMAYAQGAVPPWENVPRRNLEGEISKERH